LPYSFPFVANLFFRLLTSIFKFPIFRLTIAIIWNNSIPFVFALLLHLPPPQTCLCHRIFGSFFKQSHLLHQFSPQLKFKWKSLCKSWFTNYTYSSNSLNSTKEGFVCTFFVCSPITCKPSCVCYCCCYKCCELLVVSIQSSYTSPSKCKWSSPFRNLVSCFLLTSCLCSLNCLSYGDVICRTSCLYSLSCPSRGDVICGTSIVYLVACTIIGTTYIIIGTTHTILGTKDGSTLPLSILCALAIMLSYFLLHSQA
jgi:hypothetical protein